MFRRESSSPQVEAPVVAPEPVERRPMRDADCFKPSSFASRKAEAEAARAQLDQRRLVSLGATEFSQRNRRTGEIEYLPAELFMDVDKPMERFVRIDGGAPIALHSTSGKEDRVDRVPGTIRTGHRRDTGIVAQPDPPPRPV